MTSLTIALDWTPNINHIGFFVAKKLGFYEKNGIKVKIVDPSADNYRVTPAKKVELGLADFALCPTESIISYRTKQKPFPLIGIAAILQKDLSAIAVRTDSKITSPKNLDGKTYASYEARYEDQIVKQLIKNDGGKGNIKLVYPKKLGIWETLKNKKFDSTWIFMNWEGVEAALNGIDLTLFKMEDYGVPYSYSPLLVANDELIEANKNDYTAFLRATKKGFMHAITNPIESAEILKNVLPELDQEIDLIQAIKLSSDSFGNTANWGDMNPKTVSTFLKWIYEQQLETIKVKTEELINNSLLEDPS